MACFLCDCALEELLSNFDTSTKHQQIPLSSILQEFIGSDVELAIASEERICQMCKLLFDEIDFLRHKLKNAENILYHKLNRTYKLNINNQLPAIRLDEQSANLFDKGDSKRKFNCKKCEYSCDFIDCLIPHSLLHKHIASVEESSIDDFVCKECNLILSSLELFKQHLELFHIVDQVDTSESNSIGEIDGFNDSSTEQDNEGLSECPNCRETLIDQEQYSSHLKAAHFICDKCNKKCRNAITLTNHVKLRHTQHVCDICGKQLGSLLSYQAHVSLHNSDHKFICPHCQKGFRASSLLATHIVIHTKESNFTCHICGQNFIHQRAHRLHLKWHQNPRPYKCQFCDKAFKHSSHLAIHRRTHSGERPNACSYCDLKFVSSSKLKTHLSTHTGVYLHSCSICGKGYNQRYKLAHHMLRIHDDDAMIINKPKCQYKLIINPEFQQRDQ